MDAKLLSPFMDACLEVLPQLGIQNVTKGNLSLKEKLFATMNVTSIVGLSKDLWGNIAYSMSEDTAKKIASIMMMGIPVETFDTIAKSAISELSNMLTARASVYFEGMGMSVQISPPTLIIGDNVTIMVSQVRTFAIEINTEVGLIELNIGIEV